MNKQADTNEKNEVEKNQPVPVDMRVVWVSVVPVVLAVAIITFITVIRKSRVIQPETEVKQPQESSFTATGPGNREGVYSGYREQTFESPDRKWMVKIENLVDFDGKCQGRISLYDDKGQEVNSSDEKGWKGNYRTSCSLQEKSGSISAREAGFSGWAKTKAKFFIISPVSDRPGITEARYAILTHGKWVQTSFDIRGELQIATDELDYLATAEKIVPGQGMESSSIHIYGQDGRQTLTKDIKTTADLNFLPVDGTDKIIVSAPQSDGVTAGQEEVYLYLVDMAAGRITGPVAGFKTPAGGEGCGREMKAESDSQSGSVMVGGGCLKENYRL